MNKINGDDLIILGLIAFGMFGVWTISHATNVKTECEKRCEATQ